MTLILLAISLTITACVIAWNLAIYALPVMAAITAAQFAWGAGAGVLGHIPINRIPLGGVF